MNMQVGNHGLVHPMTPEGSHALEPKTKLMVFTAFQQLVTRKRLSQ